MKVRTLLGYPPPCNAPGRLGRRPGPQLPQSQEAGSVPLRRNLQEPGNLPESLVVDELAERECPDGALADVRVTVDTGSERLHGIIEVEGADGADPENPVELFESGLVTGLGGDVVPGGEDMAGVEADGDAIRGAAPVADRPQLLESAAHAGALASRGLEKDLAGTPVGGEHLVESGGDVADSLRVVRVRAGMDDERGNPEQIGPFELVDEGGDRLVAQIALIATQVDQVARVDRAGKRRVVAVRTEGARTFRGDLLGPPHPGGLREDLDGFRSVRPRAGERFVEAACRRFVGA